MKAFIIAIAIAAVTASTYALDVDTVSYAALEDIPSAGEAEEAILSDIDEFMEDVERRIRRLDDAALEHRGSAMVYDAASRKAHAAGDDTAAASLGDTVHMLIALAESERECAKWLSSLMTAVAEYELTRIVGPHRGDAGAEGAQDKGWLGYYTTVVLEKEEKVAQYSKNVENLRKASHDALLKYIGLVREEAKAARQK